MTVPVEYRRLALQCGTRKPIGLVARALYRHQTEMETPVVEIARDAGIHLSLLTRWVRDTNLRSRRELTVETRKARVIEIFDECQSATEVARRLGVSRGAVKNAMTAAGRKTLDKSSAVREALSLVYVAPAGWATSREVCAELGCSRTFVSTHCRNGKIPGARLEPLAPGSPRTRWLIPRDWLNRQPRKAGGLTSGRQDTWLPARPLGEWIEQTGLGVKELHRQTGVPERRLYEVRENRQQHVTLTVADQLLTAMDTRLDDVWPDLDKLLTGQQAA